jgi:hypothetical protein
VQAQYILVASVPAVYLFNAASRAYEPRTSGAVGCVIVGGGAAYSLMFYGQDKATVCLAPITPAVRQAPKRARGRAPARARACARKRAKRAR